METMNWESLLSKRRLSEDAPHRLYSEDDLNFPPSTRSEFQRDHDRILFTSSFRRLKDKTQVFPLAESDYVRTRLTHSFEASSVGRSLGRLIAHRIQEAKLAGRGEEHIDAQDFGAIVSATCLAHDIGNPPFGHSGEDALQRAFARWYKANAKRYRLRLTKQERLDLSCFEGNAQGFRVLTRLQPVFPVGGMQLTCAMLAAYTKYPRKSYILPKLADDYLKDKKHLSKHGFFSQDEPTFRLVADEVGLLVDRNAGGSAWARHPLAFLVEAADDICYRVIDWEDGFKLGLISYETAAGALAKLLKNAKPEIGNGQPFDEQKNIIARLRSGVINRLIFMVGDVFMERYDAIMAGEFSNALLDEIKGPYAEALAEIREKSVKFLYRNDKVVEIELAGYNLLGDLASALWSAQFEEDKFSKKHRILLENHTASGYETPYEKLLQVTDFVSGMTDSFAVSFSQKIKGISLAT
jgi:dGTPase